MHTVLTASVHFARVAFSGCGLLKGLERKASWIQQSSDEGQIEAAESRAVRRRRASSFKKIIKHGNVDYVILTRTEKSLNLATLHGNAPEWIQMHFGAYTVRFLDQGRGEGGVSAALSIWVHLIPSFSVQPEPQMLEN